MRKYLTILVCLAALGLVLSKIGDFIILKPNPSVKDNMGTLPYCDDMSISPGGMDTLGLMIPRPVFNHVNRVIIVVTSPDDETLPNALHQKNLESMLQDIYVARYGPLEWCDRCTKAGCYNRTSPPVEVLPFVTEEDKIAAKSLSLKDDVLTVYTEVTRVSGDEVAVKIINYRPHLDRAFWREWLDIPEVFWEVNPKSRHNSAIYNFDLQSNQKKLNSAIKGYFLGKVYPGIPGYVKWRE